MAKFLASAAKFAQDLVKFLANPSREIAAWEARHGEPVKHTMMNGPSDDAACVQCTAELLKRYPDADPAQAYILWPCDTVLAECSHAWGTCECPYGVRLIGDSNHKEHTEKCDWSCTCDQCEASWENWEEYY